MTSVWSKRPVAISLVVHAALVLLLWVWYRPNLSNQSNRSEPIHASSSDAIAKQQTALPLIRDKVLSANPIDVPEDQIRKSVESQISEARKVPDEVKLSSLEKNLKRLDAVADPSSVQQLTETIATTMGLDSQAYQPRASDQQVASSPSETPPFDFQTAQLMDVKRQMGEDGQWFYESEMVDRGGNTMTVPMSRTEGAKMYDVFAKINQYPMAAGIYRSVVMPMLQKMIETEEATRRSSDQNVDSQIPKPTGPSLGND
jgi:hypothetical protein